MLSDDMQARIALTRDKMLTDPTPEEKEAFDAALNTIHDAIKASLIALEKSLGLANAARVVRAAIHTQSDMFEAIYQKHYPLGEGKT